MRFGEIQKTTFKIGQKRAPFQIGQKKSVLAPDHAKKNKDVPPIREHTNIKVNNTDDLREIVEEPCLKACQQLRDLSLLCAKGLMPNGQF